MGREVPEATRKSHVAQFARSITFGMELGYGFRVETRGPPLRYSDVGSIQEVGQITVVRTDR